MARAQHSPLVLAQVLESVLAASSPGAPRPSSSEQNAEPGGKDRGICVDGVRYFKHTDGCATWKL